MYNLYSMYRFKAPMRVVWKSSRFGHFELVQHEKRIQVPQLREIMIFIDMVGGAGGGKLTSGLPTLLLTRAPTPSACSTERTFLTIARAGPLISLSSFTPVLLNDQIPRESTVVTCESASARVVASSSRTVALSRLLMEQSSLSSVL